MTPTEYEALVGSHYRRLGYAVDDRPATSDWGVDLIASNEVERLAIQAKMYGGATRPVNRAMVMELHGAAAYFGCDRAVLATDGRVLPDAALVAERLGIEILRIDAVPSVAPSTGAHGDASFDVIWERYVIPLAGTTITADDGRTNRILHVDWSGVVRESSRGRRQQIRIEVFRSAVECILRDGSITRVEVNDMYPGRAPSGICLILAQVPTFEYGGRPLTLRLRA